MKIRGGFVPGRPVASLPLAALINGLTLLLLLVLVGLRAKVAPELPADYRLPSAGSLPDGVSEAELRDALEIVLTPKEARIGGSEFSLDSPVPTTELVNAIERESLRGEHPKRQIVLHGDANVPYGQVERIVRAAASVGLTRIQFAAQGGTRR